MDRKQPQQGGGTHHSLTQGVKPDQASLHRPSDKSPATHNTNSIPPAGRRKFASSYHYN